MLLWYFGKCDNWICYTTHLNVMTHNNSSIYYYIQNYLLCIILPKIPNLIQLQINSVQDSGEELVWLTLLSVELLTSSNQAVLQHLSWKASKTAGLPPFKYTELQLSAGNHSASEHFPLKSIQFNLELIHLSLLISISLCDSTLLTYT